MTTPQLATAPFPSGLIRPWHPGALIGNTSVFEAHLYPDCQWLLEVRPEPVEGLGWLNPDDGATCTDCLSREKDDDE